MNAADNSAATASEPDHRWREPGVVIRFLWFCAGADADLLKQCPRSDWVKLQGVGGIVLATAVLAFASGSYAFYTVFEPKEEMALAQQLDLRTLWIALVAGAVWSAVIFNIDRFIVSSSGHGDGTEKITFSELLKSTPRLIMASIIGICISAPLEIRILKPEIDAQLELEQNEYLAKLNRQTEEQTHKRKEELRQKIEVTDARLAAREQYFEKRRLEIRQQRRRLEEEAEGHTKTGVAGRGPAWRDKKETLDQMLVELERDRKRDAEKNQSHVHDIARWKKDLAAIKDQVSAARISNRKQAQHLDGLMKRIHIAHQVGGFVPLFIMLLLLAVETGPVFFKMMLSKGAYDYLQENAHRLAIARAGVEVNAQIYLPETNEEIRLDVYHEVNAAIEEERRRWASEAALAAKIHQRFREETEAEIAVGDAYRKYIEPATTQPHHAG